MNAKLKSLILPFYFGSIADEDRVVVERELLTDSEVLLDYLDLKRTIEKADLVPQQPSVKVWSNLQSKIKTRRKLFLSLSMGAAAAVLLILSILVLNKSQNKTDAPVTSGPEILFDSISEPSGSSSVL